MPRRLIAFFSLYLALPFGGLADLRAQDLDNLQIHGFATHEVE